MPSAPLDHRGPGRNGARAGSSRTRSLVDPATLSDAERERIGASRYPEDLGAALDALERDDVLTSAMGEALTTSYVAVRRSEFEAYGAMDEAAQYRGHFAKY